MITTEGLQNQTSFEAQSQTSPAVDQYSYFVSLRAKNESQGWIVKSDDKEGMAYRFVVASDPETRERAYRLAYHVYRAAGLIAFDPSAMVTSPYDALPETFTLLVEDMSGEGVATVSLVLDSARGLPCDEIYAEELRALRNSGRRLVEVTRLAIAEKHKNSRSLLVHMFNLIYIFSHRVWNATDFVIEVNPHHVNYYRRMLVFEVIGGEKPCPRVKGAPAILLRLDFAVTAEEVRLVGGTNGMERSARGRTLYPYFYPADDEDAIAEFLAQHFNRAIAPEAESLDEPEQDIDVLVAVTAS